jgi:NAD(P)-dependent dehydrogenase (short-subunit alcohol dehydrogenase family)
MRAVITGGTSGIGYGAARHLTELGWDVTVVGRNTERGVQIATDLGVRFIEADLALLSEATRLANLIPIPLDALLLSAGIVFTRPDQPFTSEGLETTFATNYLSRFVLSQLLLPKMSPNGCIVMISGDGNHKSVSMDWDEPHFGMASAQKAALAVDLYAVELAKANLQIRVHTCYPGIVRTNLLRNAPLPMRLFVRLFGSSIEHGSSFAARLVTENHTAVHWNKDKPLVFSPPLPDDNNALIDFSQGILEKHAKEYLHAL